MKTILRFPLILFGAKRKLRACGLFILFLFQFNFSIAQCAAGYTSATINWDNLDYFHTFGNYGLTNPVTGLPFVTTAMKQTQYFAIGTNRMTLATVIPVVSSGTVSGDVTTHNGDVPGYTGADISYLPTANGQTITLTFATEVKNASFTLYDVDRSAKYTFTATNAASTAQTIAVATYATSGASILTIAGNGTTSASVTATITALASPDNRGTATVTVAGPVKTIIITATTIGTDASFWLSDIIACVADPGFPTSYYSTYTTPFTGQPGYFLVNPQNLNVFMVDPATAIADYVFSDPGTSGTKMNSLAYDPVNHWLYYVMDLNATPPSNLTLKKYDFTTGTISTVIANIATFGIPSFIQGIEFAGASFYNGSLYLGIEGSDGTSYSTNGESDIWRIDFDGSGNATTYCETFGTPGDNGGGAPSHDWGDFVIKDGVIITHATGPTTTSNGYIHYTMQTGASTPYAGNAVVAGQLAQTYNGNIYRVKNDVALYNNNGTIGAATAITLTSCSLAWSGNAGDASDPFKPQCDFGDAPGTYDPVSLSPAVNQKACNNSTLRIGALWDREWTINTSADASGDGSDEDGITTVTTMVSDGVAYNHVQDVTVLNNTGLTATLAGWLDYNANGVFDVGEGRTVSVPSSASPQTITLSWLGITVALGTPDTYLRVRLVGNGNTMTASNPTGWYSDGETEDYKVISQAAPLSIQLLDLKAEVTKEKNVQLTWKAITGSNAKGFEILRSEDQSSWEKIGYKEINQPLSNSEYNFLDLQPRTGRIFYKLKLVEQSGSSRYSSTKLIYLDEVLNTVRISPNPITNNAMIQFSSGTATKGIFNIRSFTGQLISSKNIILKEGDNKFPFNSSTLQTGMYLVELITPGKVYVNKMIVVK